MNDAIADETWHPAPEVTVLLEQQRKTVTIPRPKTVRQLMQKLGYRPGMCLVIREEPDGSRTLLTPDLQVAPGQRFTVRGVISSG